MSQVTVWAYGPLPELDNATGFVAVDAELAEKLIEEGAVQDLNVGGLNLKAITGEAPTRSCHYDTKVMTADTDKPKKAKSNK